MTDLKNFIRFTVKKCLNEAKSVPLLYHFTDEAALKSILSSNQMEGSYMFDDENGNEVYSVSTTRNKRLNFGSHSEYWDKNVRITLDGSKLSNNYKIKPNDYWYRIYNVPDNPQTVDEDEELILTPKGYISDIKKYIISIDRVNG